VLAGQVSENGLLMALLGLTTISMAVWLYGRYNRPGTGILGARLGLIGALVLLLIGLNLGWPRAAASTDIVWEPWSAERVAQLRAAGRPIYADFTARWCATCQANKKVVFASDAVKHYFRDHKVATLKADWTNADPLITAELAKWHRSAVPFDLIYLPANAEPKALPELLTPGIVLKAFDAS
jgi:thiol:disulfide interchange protein DsbD